MPFPFLRRDLGCLVFLQDRGCDTLDIYGFQGKLEGYHLWRVRVRIDGKFDVELEVDSSNCYLRPVGYALEEIC